jgi:SAM-dependent methyltransferase
LCGIDPDPAMLKIARSRTDVEWRHATAASIAWTQEFDLATMSGHAFQVLIDDDELRASLAGIHKALTNDGRFAFETRNPLVRAWESWNSQHPIDVIDPAGRPIRISYDVEAVVGDVVTVVEITSDRDGTSLRRDRARLRFLEVDPLAAFLSGAGFRIEAQYGDWSRAPLTEASPEIITIARA